MLPSPPGRIGSRYLSATAAPTSSSLAFICSPSSFVTASFTVVAELSTLSLETKQDALDRLSTVGIGVLDCPISGTGAQAITGDLVLFCSGDEAAHLRCAPVFGDFARAVHFVGPFGQGTKMKFVANRLVAILNGAAAEAIELADRAGLDLDRVLDVVGSGAAGFRLLDLRGPMMARGVYDPPTMKLSVWEKDLRLIENFARELGAPTPLFASSRQLYEAALDDGRGDEDTASIREVLRHVGGKD